MIPLPEVLDQDAFLVWVRQVLRPRILERNIHPHVFDAAMSEVSFRPDIIERQNNQKEFSLPVWEYLDIVTTEDRVRKGRQEMRRHRALLNRIEQDFGVEPAIIAAIWGLETGYGVNRGNIPIVSALATLAWRGRRAAYFEYELVAVFRLVQSRGCAPSSMIGSWAGAVGHGQFMPSSVLNFAVDFDRDGVHNICGDDPTDALASVANYLRKHDWKTGQPWGFQVRLPDGFNYALSGTDQTRSSADWAAMGVVSADGGPVPDYGAGSIFLPVGARGLAFLVLRNFHVITRYNKSEAYALGIGLLSDRILGDRPLRGEWPTNECAITRGDVIEIQFLLSQAGFDTLGVDGLPGPNTVRAVRDFQKAQGLVPDGHLDREILAALRALARG
ncbi:lytic murein transglycosylase [Sinisalibacter lacisalsi]|uniref:Murein transglycosylase n=1 Tax=Sinisalibacter lacisalsi TaxID=1526570 RepID=A0ABQ1QCH2_9RHOB|nr:lytic murein transglycosylase [Sinisalibacter lacisalsi]GGD21887.1 murein transglycosylase [Sinisalibacter lacisalsi]